MNEYKKKLAELQAGQQNSKSSAQEQMTNGIPNSALLSVFEGRSKATSQMMGHRENLAESIKAKMSQSFGMDLSGLQIYRSDAMAGTGMHGMAQGNKVVLSSDVNLNTTEGQAVLGHELSHIRAQSQGIGMGRSGLYNNAALEARADREGVMAARGLPIYGDTTYVNPGMSYGLGMKGVEGLTPLSANGGISASAGAPMQAKKEKTPEQKEAEREAAFDKLNGKERFNVPEIDDFLTPENRIKDLEKRQEELENGREKETLMSQVGNYGGFRSQNTNYRGIYQNADLSKVNAGMNQQNNVPVAPVLDQQEQQQEPGQNENLIAEPSEQENLQPQQQESDDQKLTKVTEEYSSDFRKISKENSDWNDNDILKKEFNDYIDTLHSFVVLRTKSPNASYEDMQDELDKLEASKQLAHEAIEANEALKKKKAEENPVVEDKKDDPEKKDGEEQDPVEEKRMAELKEIKKRKREYYDSLAYTRSPEEEDVMNKLEQIKSVRNDLVLKNQQQRTEKQKEQYQPYYKLYDELDSAYTKNKKLMQVKYDRYVAMDEEEQKSEKGKKLLNDVNVLRQGMETTKYDMTSLTHTLNNIISRAEEQNKKATKVDIELGNLYMKEAKQKLNKQVEINRQINEVEDKNEEIIKNPDGFTSVGDTMKSIEEGSQQRKKVRKDLKQARQLRRDNEQKETDKAALEKMTKEENRKISIANYDTKIGYTLPKKEQKNLTRKESLNLLKYYRYNLMEQGKQKKEGLTSATEKSNVMMEQANKLGKIWNNIAVPNEMSKMSKGDIKKWKSDSLRDQQNALTGEQGLWDDEMDDISWMGSILATPKEEDRRNALAEYREEKKQKAEVSKIYYQKLDEAKARKDNKAANQLRALWKTRNKTNTNWNQMKEDVLTIANLSEQMEEESNRLEAARQEGKPVDSTIYNALETMTAPFENQKIDINWSQVKKSMDVLPVYKETTEWADENNLPDLREELDSIWESGSSTEADWDDIRQRLEAKKTEYFNAIYDPETLEKFEEMDNGPEKTSQEIVEQSNLLHDNTGLNNVPGYQESKKRRIAHDYDVNVKKNPYSENLRNPAFVNMINQEIPEREEENDEESDISGETRKVQEKLNVNTGDMKPKNKGIVNEENNNGQLVNGENGNKGTIEIRNPLSNSEKAAKFKNRKIDTFFDNFHRGPLKKKLDDEKEKTIINEENNQIDPKALREFVDHFGIMSGAPEVKEPKKYIYPEKVMEKKEEVIKAYEDEHADDLTYTKTNWKIQVENMIKKEQSNKDNNDNEEDPNAMTRRGTYVMKGHKK